MRPLPTLPRKAGEGKQTCARRAPSLSAIRHPLSASGSSSPYAVRRPPVTSSGFTIVELVVVIVLIGILAGFAVPRFFSQQPFAARGYADEIASALRHAQKVAVASGCEVSVSIDGSGYQAAQRPLSGTACSNSGAWSVPVMRGDGTVLDGAPPTDANVAAPVQMVFTPAGQLQGGAPGPIQIGAHTIAVDAMTGFVSVQ